MHSQPVQDLFSVYLVLAVSYNLLSLILAARKGKASAPTDPLTGILVMSVLYLIYATGDQVSIGLYLFFLASFTALIFSFGVIGHIRNYDDSRYFSRLTWLSAFGINIYGVVVLLLMIVSGLATKLN